MTVWIIKMEKVGMFRSKKVRIWIWIFPPFCFIGGCDGCMNFDENHNDNHGLQHSVAILERLYTDVDYPKWRKKWPNLEASPYDLGMSRADLWAFAGRNDVTSCPWLSQNAKIFVAKFDFTKYTGNGQPTMAMVRQLLFISWDIYSQITMFWLVILIIT